MTPYQNLVAAASAFFLEQELECSGTDEAIDNIDNFTSEYLLDRIQAESDLLNEISAKVREYFKKLAA